MADAITSREQEIKNAILAALIPLRQKLKGYRVFPFGSRAEGTARPRSDFDIGILGDQPLSRALFFEIQDRLENIRTLYRIDLVDFTRVNSGFKSEALQHTETLYEA